jgi:hypothetical protein
MIVYGYRQDTLGSFLANNVLIEKILDFGWLGNAEVSGDPFSRAVLGNNLTAQINAFVTDIDVRACNELADLVVALATERAGMHIASAALLGHTILPYERPRSRIL